MKSTPLALGSLLVAAAVAQPHRHQHHHQKRVVWVTDWDYVTETVGITTTIWVSSGFVPPTTSSEAPSSSSASEVPAEFFQPQQKSSVHVAPTPSTSSTSSVYVAPTPSSTYVAPAPSSSEAPAYVAPVVESSSSSSPSPVYVPETTSAAPAYVAPTTSEAPAPAATSASSSSSSSGSSSGECSSGSPCTGDITYYTAGLGACGSTSDGDAEKVVALPHGLMGTQSNGNPYCGKTITVKCSATGKTTTATVVDKCMGCDDYSIDLSNKAFLELDDFSVGRTTAEWWFN
jgi:hypothetical protein